VQSIRKAIRTRGRVAHPKRIGTAIAIAPITALVIDKNEMIRVLHAEHAFSDRFISHMLSRNIRVEEDLVDQLFNSTEKRLARTLLLLARYGKQDHPQGVLPRMSQETLAEMIGTGVGVHTRALAITAMKIASLCTKYQRLTSARYFHATWCAGEAHDACREIHLS
jgi:CRP-like cAMP-binding protein